MAKSSREREDDKRDERFENMREQIAAGDLTVRQMTPEERARWDEHSAASTRHMGPEERARRSAAQQKRAPANDAQDVPGRQLTQRRAALSSALAQPGSW